MFNRRDREDRRKRLLINNYRMAQRVTGNAMLPDWNDDMKKGKIITDDNKIKEILLNAKTVAIVGLSPKPERDSHMVAGYLKDAGYKIIPVRPAQKEILGEKVYAGLEQIREQVDIVDVFRRSDQIEPHAKEAIRIMPKVFWMQLGIENLQAASLLTQSGIDVVMNRCIKIEHDRLCKKIKL